MTIFDSAIIPAMHHLPIIVLASFLGFLFPAGAQTIKNASYSTVAHIKDDGTITATTNGEDDGAGTWEETDSGINISDDTGETIDGTLEDGVLTINLYGVEIKMEKE